eukprot:1599600-Amphidinium_carterae.1
MCEVVVKKGVKLSQWSCELCTVVACNAVYSYSVPCVHPMQSLKNALIADKTNDLPVPGGP